MKKKQALVSLILMGVISFYLVVGLPKPAYAMHIMEGFLPVQWAIFWWIVALGACKKIRSQSNWDNGDIPFG